MDLARAELLHFLAQCAEDAYYQTLPPCALSLEDDRVRRGFIALTAFGTVIAIKGTADLKDMATDAMIEKVLFLGKYRVHRGFHQEFLEIWPKLQKAKFSRPVYVTGHSMGAAIATLIALALKEELGIHSHCAPFASPRVGDDAFRAAYNSLVSETTRIVHSADVVPRWPHLGYSHVDDLLHVDDHGRILSRPHSFLRWLFEFGEIVIKDLSFESLKDHHIATYVYAMERLVERERRKA